MALYKALEVNQPTKKKKSSPGRQASVFSYSCFIKINK